MTLQDTDVNHSLLGVNHSLRNADLFGAKPSLPKAEIPFQDLLETEENFTSECSETGTSESGQSSCIRHYEDGSSVTLVKNYEWLGREFKNQIRAIAYDSEKNPGNRRTVRQRVIYRPDKQTKVSEFVDVVNRPVEGKVSRQIILYQFHPSGQLKQVTWTYYDQIGVSTYAGLKYHAVLFYDPDGQPLQILAETWEDGQKKDTLLEWNRYSDGLIKFDSDLWQQWQDKIWNASHRQVLD